MIDDLTPYVSCARVTPFWAPKAGSTDDEYEDACIPRRVAEWSALHGAEREWRCAVADGATEAAFTGIWAKILVRAYAAGDLCAEDFWEGLRPLRQKWVQAVNRSTAGRPMPWYLEEKRRAGAFAALAGLTLPDNWWTALAQGDSCLFQLRAGELLYAFPVRRSADFGSRPALVPTSPAREDRRALRVTTGEWRRGDTFLLMSDALAAWFLRGIEQGAPRWPLPDALGASAEAERTPAFAEWIAGLRDAHVLRNDDVTLVWVKTDGLAAAF